MRCSRVRYALKRLPGRLLGVRLDARMGPFTRLVSPGDIGELIKPFVFLDYFDADSKYA
jgi:hypothetical protein